jgi:hypothetical protein
MKGKIHKLSTMFSVNAKNKSIIQQKTILQIVRKQQALERDMNYQNNKIKIKTKINKLDIKT